MSVYLGYQKLCVLVQVEERLLSVPPSEPLHCSTPLHGSVQEDEVSSDEVGSFESLDSCSLDISQLPKSDCSLEMTTSHEPLLCIPSTPPDPVNPQVIRQSLNSGYKLVFDNINKNIKPRYMRADAQTISLNYVQMYGVKDRIDYSSAVSCQRSSVELNLYDILPSSRDYDSLKQDFTVLISRMIVNYLPFFREDFNNLVEKHIPHKYSHEMCKKSGVVSAYTYISSYNYVLHMYAQSFHSTLFTECRFHLGYCPKMKLHMKG